MGEQFVSSSAYFVVWLPWSGGLRASCLRLLRLSILAATLYKFTTTFHYAKLSPLASLSMQVRCRWYDEHGVCNVDHIDRPHSGSAFNLLSAVFYTCIYVFMLTCIGAELYNAKTELHLFAHGNDTEFLFKIGHSERKVHVMSSIDFIITLYMRSFRKKGPSACYRFCLHSTLRHSI